MSLETYTFIHVVISLVGLLSGLVVLFGLLTQNRFDRWTAIFLVATALTSITGLLFPSRHILPSHIVGILSLVTLATAAYARYNRRLNNWWRGSYVVCAVLALYFNVFVAIVQAFLKVPLLKAIAPTQTEPPFKYTQIVVLALFVVLGTVATNRFHREATHPT